MTGQKIWNLDVRIHSKISLEHSHSHSFTDSVWQLYPRKQQQSWVGATKAIQSAKPTIYCLALDRKSLSILVLMGPWLMKGTHSAEYDSGTHQTLCFEGRILKMVKFIILKPKIYPVLEKYVGLEGRCKNVCEVLCKKDPVLVPLCIHCHFFRVYICLRAVCIPSINRAVIVSAFKSLKLWGWCLR